MYKSRINGGKAANVAAANDLTIGNGNKVTVTGNGTVNGIRVLNWLAGAEIDIILTGTPTFKHNTAASSGYASLILAGEVDFVADAESTLTLLYDGTYWQEKCRRTSVPSHANQAAVAAQTQDTLTDSTGGTANTTLVDVGAVPLQAAINDNFADIAAQLAKIRTDIAAIKTFQDQNRTDQITSLVIKGSA